MTLRILAVIPVRMSSTRLPGKPLALLGDRPMVRWVYEAARACAEFDQVVVATDSEKIAEAVRSFGGRVELTRSDHESGSDRVAEVAARRVDADVIVNVQGDQPFVRSSMLEELVAPFRSHNPPAMATLGAPLSPEQGADPNVVKVLCDANSDAMIFTRAAVPYRRNAPVDGDLPVLHHIGLYAYSRDFLLSYATMEPTPLERCEGLEQLRVLEHGYRIRVSPTDASVLEVNTPSDLEAAVQLIRRQG